MEKKAAETKLDKTVGIGIAALVKTRQISASIAKIKNRVGAHYHKHSDEIYLILHGSGKMHWGKPKRKTVQWKKPLRVKQGNLFLIPKGMVHSLENTGRQPLVIAFFSSPPFSKKDRALVENQE